VATGIRDKVAIIGMGCTKFGERWDVGAEELLVEAFQEALEDAGIGREEIQAAWLGTCMDEISVGKSALPLSLSLRLPMIPVTRVENYCATGTEAFRGACYAVASVRTILPSPSESRSSRTSATVACRAGAPMSAA